MTRPVCQAAKALIKTFEGCKLQKYTDSAGNSTIGIGHRIQPGENIPDVITQEQCETLFDKDLSNASDTCGLYITADLSDNPFGALCSLVFNIGTAPLKGTLGGFLNEALYPQAAEQFQRWAYAGGQISDGLVRRRAAEKQLFLTPDT